MAGSARVDSFFLKLVLRTLILCVSDSLDEARYAVSGKQSNSQGLLKWGRLHRAVH